MVSELLATRWPRTSDVYTCSSWSLSLIRITSQARCALRDQPRHIPHMALYCGPSSRLPLWISPDRRAFMFCHMHQHCSESITTGLIHGYSSLWLCPRLHTYTHPHTCSTDGLVDCMSWSFCDRESRWFYAEDTYWHGCRTYAAISINWGSIVVENESIRKGDFVIIFINENCS